MPTSSPSHPHKKRIAVLIDAENVSFKLVDEIFDEVALLGWATHRRVYGDFSIDHMKGWNSVASDFALRQVIQQHNTTGKNSSDIVLVIDAMDILHSREVDAICIVSHDSDFTRLAMRIAESGVEVIGMGERARAGASFVKACSDFRYIEDKNNGVKAPSLPHKNSTNEPGKKAAQQPAKPPTKTPGTVARQSTASAKITNANELLAATEKLLSTAQSATPQSGDFTRKNVVAFIKRALLEAHEEWLHIGQLGSSLHNRWPDFDPRHIGAPSKQLGTFLKTLPDFETKDGKLRLRSAVAAS